MKTITMTVEQVAAIRAILKSELLERQWEVLRAVIDTTRRVKKDSDEEVLSTQQCLTGLGRYANSWAINDRPFVTALARLESNLTDLSRPIEVSLRETTYSIIGSILNHEKYQSGGRGLELSFTADDIVLVIIRRNIDGLRKVFGVEEAPKDEKPFSFPQPPPEGGILN